MDEKVKQFVDLLKDRASELYFSQDSQGNPMIILRSWKEYKKTETNLSVTVYTIGAHLLKNLEEIDSKIAKIFYDLLDALGDENCFLKYTGGYDYDLDLATCIVVDVEMKKIWMTFDFMSTGGVCKLHIGHIIGLRDGISPISDTLFKHYLKGEREMTYVLEPSGISSHPWIYINPENYTIENIFGGTIKIPTNERDYPSELDFLKCVLERLKDNKFKIKDAYLDTLRLVGRLQRNNRREGWALRF